MCVAGCLVERITRLRCHYPDDSDIRQMSTRWLLFQVPVYVLAEDKGQTLRFVSPYQIPPNTANMRKLLVDSEYKKLPVWSGRLSYNGD